MAGSASASPLVAGMRRAIILAAVLALVAIAQVWRAPSASAGWLWCSDPTLVINGRAVHLEIGVEQKKLLTGSALTVVLPYNVTAHLSGSQAQNFPVSLTILREGFWDGTGPVQLRASATVTSPVAMATLLRATSGGKLITETSGTAGKTMSISFLVQ